MTIKHHIMTKAHQVMTKSHHMMTKPYPISHTTKAHVKNAMKKTIQAFYNQESIHRNRKYTIYFLNYFKRFFSKLYSDFKHHRMYTFPKSYSL